MSRIMKKLLPTLALALSLALAPGSAHAQLTKKASIQENLKSGLGSTQFILDKVGAGNEVTLRMVAPASSGTGFRWGAYASSTVVDAVRILDNHEGGFGAFINIAYDPGQYFYTIFSSAGTNTPDQYVDLSGPSAAITYNIFSNGGLATPAFKIRFLIRTNSGAKWYVSSLADVPSPVPSSATANFKVVNTLTWYAVNSDVVTNLNKLADGDEMDVLGAFATTASTPDLTKVDGGGWMIAEGAISTGSAKPSLKMSRLTWADSSPLIKVSATPSYTKDTSKLVMGLGANTGTATLLSNGPESAEIRNVSLLSGDGRITLSGAPAVPATVTGTTGLDVNMAFNQNGTLPSTATLAVTYRYGTSAADIMTTFPVLGRGIIDGTIYESFNVTNANMAAARDTTPNETPLVMNAPPTGTGFCWGAYTNAHSSTGGRDQVGFNGNRLTFFGATTDDANTGGAYHGSYAYTIFDTLTSGATVDRTLNLHKFQYYCDNIPTGAQIRWLVRDDQNRWFMSKNAINMTSDMVNKLVYSDVDDLTLGWLRVDAAAETHMNALPLTKVTPSPQAPIGDAGTLAAGTPNLLKVTGAGVYLEVGNTDATNTPFTFPDLNFIARPSNGDTMKVASTAVTENYKVANRRLALAGLTFDVTSGLDAALDGVDVTVTPNTTGLRSVMLYSDPNGNGRPEDGVELTNCTLDASTAHVLFRDNQIFLAGAQRKLALVAVFDETAANKTYNFAITPTQWKQDPENGGTGDTIVSVPSPLVASMPVSPLNLVSTSTLFESPVVKETWENTTAGIIPVTPATGTIAGADNIWNYTWGSAANNALIATKNGSLTFGNEVKDMATEPPYNASFRIDASLNTLLNFDVATTQVTMLKFDLVITSTTKASQPARLSGRTISEGSNINVHLFSYSGGENFILTFFPLVDIDRYLFGIRYNSSMTQYAPGNILAYSNNNGVGTYRCALSLTPFSASATIAKVQVKHVESGKSLDWMTVIDGKIPNLGNLRFAYGAYPNAYIDNVDVTSYVFRVNPVKRWTLFQ